MEKLSAQDILREELARVETKASSHAQDMVRQRVNWFFTDSWSLQEIIRGEIGNTVEHTNREGRLAIPLPEQGQQLVRNCIARAFSEYGLNG